MRNIVRDLEENCNECDTEGIVKYLFEHGDINPSRDYYREVWTFFKESCKTYGERLHYASKANEDTMIHFRLSYENLKRIKNMFK